MKSFFHKMKFSDICEPLAGILFIPTVLAIIYWMAFCMPVENISRYEKISIKLNSPEYNSRLIDFYEDGKITFYEQLELNSLQSKIQDEQFVSQLKKTIK